MERKCISVANLGNVGRYSNILDKSPPLVANCTFPLLKASHVQQIIHTSSLSYVPSGQSLIAYTLSDTMGNACLGLDAMTLGIAYQQFLTSTFSQPLKSDSDQAAVLSVFQALNTYWRLPSAEEEHGFVDNEDPGISLISSVIILSDIMQL